MSADNWRVCHKCEAKRESQLINMKKQLDEQYGKVTLEKFKEKEKLLHSFQNEKLEATLREDYEIYSEGDNIYVRYSCSCEKCGLSFQKDEDWVIKDK